MLCFILVISLVLPPFILGQDAPEVNNSQMTCDTPDVKNAGDQVFDCFSKNVKNRTYKNDTACELTPLTFEFVKVINKSCYNDTRSETDAEKDVAKFIKLVEYSLRNQEFQDFVNSGGVKCLNAIKEKIMKCVNHEVGTVEDSEDKTRKYENLWQMTRISTDASSCKSTEKIKQCTLKAIRKGGCNDCKHENNVLYVGSLFNYVLETCSRETPTWMDVEDKEKNNPIINDVDRKTRTTHALLGVLLAMGILAMFYVCVRDCRAPRGQWTSMSMKYRRSSLVNNEASQQS